MAKVVTSPKFVEQMTKILDTRLRRITADLARQVKKSINIPFPPGSPGGAPPHKRTGRLRDAIFSEQIAPLEWAFGVNRVQSEDGRDKSELGVWMERGTKTGPKPHPMAARPFIEVILNDNGIATAAKYLK